MIGMIDLVTSIQFYEYASHDGDNPIFKNARTPDISIRPLMSILYKL